ncbi:MAG: endonuclease/exonuclease/phosphatase family protein [Pseudomonadota bacterium]
MFRFLAVLASVVMTVPAAALEVPPKPDGAIRFATFNVYLFGKHPGDVIARLEAGETRAELSAAVIQRVRPDVLLVQEIDRDVAGRALALYADDYLAVPQGDEPGIDYPHRLLLPTNTGEPSGVDLSGNGFVGTSGEAYARDAKGFGFFPGQYGFSLLSRLPLGEARTLCEVLWAEMPDSRITVDVSEAARKVLPVSSKTHALIPVDADGVTIHVVAAHPTPPIRSDRNVARNADEIRLLVDLLDEAESQYARDDNGVAGGLPTGSHAVVMGDLNADPAGGNSAPGAIGYLLDNPAVVDPQPTSPHAGTKTAAFRSGDKMRVDYVVPTAGLTVLQSGVYWPADGDPLHGASDHYLVWVDVLVPDRSD